MATHLARACSNRRGTLCMLIHRNVWRYFSPTLLFCYKLKVATRNSLLERPLSSLRRCAPEMSHLIACAYLSPIFPNGGNSIKSRTNPHLTPSPLSPQCPQSTHTQVYTSSPLSPRPYTPSADSERYRRHHRGWCNPRRILSNISAGCRLLHGGDGNGGTSRSRPAAIRGLGGCGGEVAKRNQSACGRRDGSRVGQCVGCR